MNRIQVIEQLKSLRDFQRQYVEDADDIVDSIYKQDVEALDIAIKALEGTALEVPVQDQSINNDLVDTIVEKISIKIASALKQLRK